MIDRLLAYVSTDGTGEGLVVWDNHLMVAVDEEAAEKLLPVAMMHAQISGVPVKLVEFERVKGKVLDIINPGEAREVEE